VIFNVIFALMALLLTPNVFAVDQGYSGNITTVLSNMGNTEEVSFYVNKITFSSDIPLSNYEFFYLTKLKPKTLLTKKNIDRAYKNLQLKKRFSSIAIDIADDGTNKNVHFTLVAHWVFKKLEFDGVWFGKSKYASMYLLQPGENFDATLHEESLKAIQNYLYDQGYFNCVVSDEIIYSQQDKTITVNIKVRKREQFNVRKAAVHIEDLQQQADLKDKSLLNAITHEIIQRFETDLKEEYYTNKQVRKNVRKIKKLLKDEGYTNAQLTLTRRIYEKKSNVDLLLNIKLGKTKIMTLEGNTVFSDNHIKEEFLSKDIPDWLFSPDIIAQQLLHEYYKKGYWHTSITPQPLGSTGYHFIIKEGAPTFIDDVEIIDSKTHVPEKISAVLNELLRGKNCDQSILDKSIERLKNFYHSSGYWDFKITSQHFAKKTSTGHYTVKISIDKGVQRLWAGFCIQDFKNIESLDFFKKYHALKPTYRIPFNIHWLQEQRVFILNELHKKGYWYADVEPELVMIPEQQLATPLSESPYKIFVDWKVKKGACIEFGKTIIRGATKVSFKRIKKQCAFKSGDSWSREKIDRTRKKLKSLDVFKTVQVQPHQLAKHKGRKDILITVVDDDPVELRARVGYFVNSRNYLFNRQNTLKAGASFIVKNPTNRADRLSVIGDWTKFERKCSLDYHLPSPFNLSAMGILKGFANKYIHPVEIRNSGSAYQALEYGALAALHDEYKNTYHWNVNIGNEWLRITKVHGNLKFNEHLIDKTLPHFFVEPNLEIDKLDSRINTTKGSITNASLKLMLPENNGDVTAKLTAEESLFYPAYKKFIVAGHLRFGHIFRRKFENILPCERFFLGGPNSVRGYEPDTLPPLGVSEGNQSGIPVKEYTIQGGSSMVNASIEMRFPIYKSFGTVLFQDIGILSQSGISGLGGRWYPGAGFGFRYKTPIGSIRFDLGWKWKRRLKEDNRSYSWYLTIGEAF
jgi:outer membrane protein assembly factor BamA